MNSRCWLMALALLFSGALQAQDVLINEDFSTASGSQPPTGWTTTNLGGQPEFWRWNNPGLRTISGSLSEPTAIFDSGTVSLDGNPEDCALESPAFDASRFTFPTTLILAYDQIFDSFGNDQIYAEVFNGAAWVQAYTATATSSASQTLDISALAGGATNARVRFRYTGNSSRYWAIDNVQVLGVDLLSGNPEITVRRGSGFGHDIYNGVTDPLGGIRMGSTTAITWTLRNDGPSTALNLTGNPLVAISGETNCTAAVSLMPTNPVPASTSGSFAIEITPSALGDFSFVVTIASNDLDESVLSFTVEGRAGLSGSYTVGKSGSTDYDNPGEAFADLEAGGVAGPVTLLLYDDNGAFAVDDSYALGAVDYSVGGLVSAPVTGTSATNTITIRAADGETPVLSGSAAMYTGSASFSLALFDTNYVKVIGLEITGGVDAGIAVLGSTLGAPGVLTDVKIDACRIHGITAGSGILVYGEARVVENLALTNNQLWNCIGGSFAAFGGMAPGVIGMRGVGANTTLMHNTVVQNNGGAGACTLSHTGGSGAGSHTPLPIQTLFANILVCTTTSRPVLDIAPGFDPSGPDRNIYYATAGAGFHSNTASYPAGFNDWQIAGKDPNGFGTDPMLVSITLGIEDLRLTAPSLAVNAVPATPVQSDGFGHGRPVGLTSDIGAHEFGTLNLGDITVIGVKSDDPDQFAFVTWVDIPGGADLRFGDDSIDDLGNESYGFLGNESDELVWEAPAGGVTAGTVVVVNGATASADVGTVRSGTLTGLSTSGDQLFVYQGARQIPHLLFGLNFGNAGWIASGSATSNNSYLPPILDVTGGNIDLGPTDSSDNAQYNSLRTSYAQLSDYQPLVLNPAFWAFNDVSIALDTTDFNAGAPAPEIDVQRGASIPDGGGDIYNSASAGVANTLTYTIRNLGGANLSITTPVSLSGIAQCTVNVTVQPAASVSSGGGTTTFTVEFTPSVVGPWSFDISITNDDSDENPYNFTVTGTAIAAPEINVLRGSNIADGGTDIVTGAAATVAGSLTYTIQNTGTGSLSITTPVSASNLVNCAVNITAQPAGSVASSGSTTLVLTVTPAAAGPFSFDLSIINDDADETPYNFTASGTAAAAPAPEINLVRGSSIADGGADVVGGGVPGTVITLTYTIQNTGNATLNITTPVSATNAVNCTAAVTVQPGGTVTAGGTTTMTVQVTPTANGSFSFDLSILNNDANENPYDLTVTGNAATPTGTNVGSGSGGGGGGGGCAGTNSGALPWLMLVAAALFALAAAKRARRTEQ